MAGVEIVVAEIPIKEQRCFSPEEMRQIVHSSTGQWKVLFAMLAGTGMRCGEAFGLRVDDLHPAYGRVCIRRSIWNGREVSVKTKKGHRVINIEPFFVQLLIAHLGDRRGEYSKPETGHRSARAM